LEAKSGRLKKRNRRNS